jgi:nitronate monooxygenase
MLENCKYPIIQAPMAGGISTAALAAAVSENGGLGFLAAGYKTTEALENEIIAMKQAGVLYGVNLFVPTQEADKLEEVNKYKARLENDWDITLELPAWSDDEWQEKLALLKHYKVPATSFTFGCPNKEIIKELQETGTYIIVTVTDSKEAWIAQQAGANAVCLQGIEAGGHRASFENTDPIDNKPLIDLLSDVLETVEIPVIVAGGIMNGEQINKFLQAGAAAVQLGTAFICCEESGANEIYKRALIERQFANTRLTRTFTGRLARGLENDFMHRYETIAPASYPTLHFLTQSIRKRALTTENPQAMSMWAGVGFKQVRALPVKELMQQLVREAGY